MMMHRFPVCTRWARLEAALEVAQSKASLIQAREARKQATSTSDRLKQSVQRNHFREAVEFQLRGDS